MLTVKQRQMNLKFLGYYKGVIDGVVMNQTKQAYKDFQKAYGLVVDGIYGAKTDAKLVAVIKEIQKTLGVTQDGIAGAKTEAARNNKNLNWDNIKYFKKSEFTCECGCGLNNIDLKLVKILDEIREHFESPIIITSGCRCQRYNDSLTGSAKNSKHIYGKAADFYVKGVSVNTLLAYTKSLVAQGKLRYTYTNGSNMSGVVHIDIN